MVVGDWYDIHTYIYVYIYMRVYVYIYIYIYCALVYIYLSVSDHVGRYTRPCQWAEHGDQCADDFLGEYVLDWGIVRSFLEAEHLFDDWLETVRATVVEAFGHITENL